VISKTAIEEFLNRPMMDYSTWKNNGNVDVSFLLPQLKTKPFRHQEVCLAIGLAEDGFLYFLDMGTGKSGIILYTLTIRRKEWKKALILSPNIVTVSTFADEVAKHSDFSCIELVGPIEERRELLKEERDLYILNYTGLQLLLTNPKDGKWVVDYQKVNEFASMFDVVVWDEVHLLKNHQSLNFKISKQLAKTIPYRWGLTGTPFNRDPIDLWSQFYLIDKGETLGESLTLYREAFFDAKNNFWGGIDYKLKKDMKQVLNKRIANKSIRYTKEEALDLPDKTFISIPVEMHPDVQKLYDEVVKEENIEIGFMKARQLCSGFLDFHNENGERITIIRDTNKLEALVELLHEVPEDSKVVVFLDFIKSGDLVSERLKKEKIKHLRLYGGTKDKKFVKDEFLNNDKIRALVANTKSGSLGLNLQSVANYVIYFEEPISNIDYTQSIDRVHRTGQEKKVFIYSLITKDSAEEKLHKYLQSGKNLLKAIMEGKESLRRSKRA
jgi:SNF2 family DNA or RNA helicase